MASAFTDTNRGNGKACSFAARRQNENKSVAWRLLWSVCLSVEPERTQAGSGEQIEGNGLRANEREMQRCWRTKQELSGDASDTDGA